MTNSSQDALNSQITQSAELSMAGMDIPWLLEQWVDKTPDKPFLIWEPFSGESESWSFRRLRDESRSLASGLASKGVKAGDFVLIHLDNSPEFVISWFACAQLGAVAVSTNTRSVARDLSYFADHVSAVCAITQPTFAELIKDSCPEIGFLVVTDNDVGVAAEVDASIRYMPFASLLDTPIDLPERATDPMANLAVQFTSGTTSRPKAVLWTHANALFGARVNAAHMRLVQDDITLTFLPLFHTNAQAYSMLGSLWGGGTMVLQPKFSASRFWPVSVKHHCTWSSMIPFAFKALAGQKMPEHNYRFWGTGAHIPMVKEIFGIESIGWWGMTETITHGIVTDLDHPGPAGNMGRAALEYGIQIRRSDGSMAKPGEKGHLFIHGVRGVSLFKEYYGDADATAKSFDENGWFDTGDIVRINECGALFFADRDKDMLKVGAENVAASEVEAVIMATELVSECAVVAQKHYMLDEVPVVFVIPNPNGQSLSEAELKEKLITYCSVNLADFKVVRDVHIVDSLPRSTLEKIAKNELRKQLPKIESGK
ncbi:MAG: AMP-binding protein [Pseudomonadales bacterium]|nr:AMP-binding protein [Pseudomonadales bacterium]